MNSELEFLAILISFLTGIAIGEWNGRRIEAIEIHKLINKYFYDDGSPRPTPISD